MTNLEEYNLGTSPCLTDTDGDGHFDDDETAEGRAPTVYDDPVIFMVMPQVAEEGQTITIIGRRLGNPVADTIVHINGISAGAPCNAVLGVAWVAEATG